MVCEKCKARVDGNVEYCPECGGRLLAEEATLIMESEPTQAAVYEATQAMRYEATQAMRDEATQVAGYDKTQVMDLDATQAAPYDVKRMMDLNATQVVSAEAKKATDLNATQVVSHEPLQMQPPVFPQTGNGLGYTAPPVQQAQKKSGKGISVAVMGAVAVLAFVLGILAYKFIPKLNGTEKETAAETAGTVAAEDKTKSDKGNGDKVDIQVVTLNPTEATGAEGVTGENLIFPSIPIINIVPEDGTTKAPATTKKPVAPQTTKRPTTTKKATTTKKPATTKRPTEPTTAFKPVRVEELKTKVKEPLETVHIGYTYINADTGMPEYAEAGIFKKDGNNCYYMKIDGGYIVVEENIDAGKYTCYVDNGSGYKDNNSTKRKCKEFIEAVEKLLLYFGYKWDETYSYCSYDYLGDKNYSGFGKVELYNMFTNNEKAGSLIVDKKTGFIIEMNDENGDYVFKLSFIDTSGSKLPKNYK